MPATITIPPSEVDYKAAISHLIDNRVKEPNSERGQNSYAFLSEIQVDDMPLRMVSYTFEGADLAAVLTIIAGHKTYGILLDDEIEKRMSVAT